MRVDDGRFLFSATDLASHLACRHLTELERARIEGRLERPVRTDERVELLRELGARHEAAYLESLRQQCDTVVTLDDLRGEPNWDATVDAMRQGVDVIAQAYLVEGRWGGYADFLMRVGRPSELGDWAYEVADTKLSRTTKATAVLQLCLYSELVAAVQGVEPEWMSVVRPGVGPEKPFDIDRLRVADFLAYYRMAKRRFELVMDGPPTAESYPEECAHCAICDWAVQCKSRWREDDHLNLVAGIRKTQIEELHKHQIVTLEALAESARPLPERPEQGSIESLQRVHGQAKIQLKGRRSLRPEYEFLEVEEGRGFSKLPEPDPGDVFLDLEGHPRAIGEPLEYLFGSVTMENGNPLYHHQWALGKLEERQAFIALIDEMTQRCRQSPAMHIYHFAPYEPSAMKRLASRHGVREFELDELLRQERFVDLLQVVRQGIRASVESYSIKALEPFYEFTRAEELPAARKALREVERLIELDLTHELTDQHRDVVRRYNEDDCLSTLRLRDWLEQLRAEHVADGHEISRPPPAKDSKEENEQRAAEIQEVFDALTCDIEGEPIGDEQRARWLLAHMLEYFRREDKCAWWEYFRLRELEEDELLYERKAVTGLTFVEQLPIEGRQRNSRHRYRIPAQEVSLDPGTNLHSYSHEGRLGVVIHCDANAGILDIRKSKTAESVHPVAVFCVDVISPGKMPESLLAFARGVAAAAQTGRLPRNARCDLLLRTPCRTRYPVSRDTDLKQQAIALVDALDNSVLPIQGPPGAGKTYIGSQMICALARQGKRIGVTAVSHKVIVNLLEAVHGASEKDIADGITTTPVRVAHRSTDKSPDLPEYIRLVADNDEGKAALHEGYVVGATTWMWASEQFDQQLDYLFIDEAGQMSLAQALAGARAAKNIVLLGDPQQLEQPQQAAHPEGSGVAALDHILGEHQTMPEELGLFLENTWRLHPRICRFTSEQYYESRLKCQSGLEWQELFGDSPFTGQGLKVVAVDHQQRQNRSQEEIETIVSIVNQLLDGSHQWSDKERTLRSLTLDDILIVAPFNAQVSALKAALPDGARVGTVDKFQGQEAPVVIYSMTSSSAADAPRGMGFLYDSHRMNVATSRARCLVILVASPRLFEPTCVGVEQLRLANGLCRFQELAERVNGF